MKCDHQFSLLSLVFKKAQDDDFKATVNSVLIKSEEGEAPRAQEKAARGGSQGADLACWESATRPREASERVRRKLVASGLGWHKTLLVFGPFCSDWLHKGQYCKRCKVPVEDPTHSQVYTGGISMGGI